MLLRMADRLIGPTLKLRRANYHLSDLDARLREFATPHPYDVVTERDEVAKATEHKFHMVKVIPEEWSLVVGDMLHNLRATLDLIAWQLVEANNGTPDDATKFPIGRRDKRSWEVGEGGAKVLARPKKAIHKDAMTVLHWLKPYKGGDDALYALHELNIVDKHSLLIPVYGALRETVMRFPDGSLIPMHMPGAGPPKPLQEGARLALMPFDADGQMEPVFDIGIAFGEAPVAGQEMLPTLRVITRQVEGVLKAFEPFLR